MGLFGLRYQSLKGELLVTLIFRGHFKEAIGVKNSDTLEARTSSKM